MEKLIEVIRLNIKRASAAFFTAVFLLWAAVCLLSALLKLINPNAYILTIRNLLSNFLDKEFDLALILFIGGAIILVELLAGTLTFIISGNRLFIVILFVINIVFTLVSHYLEHIGRLSSCGCFGSLSSRFYPYHIAVLYFFNASFIFYIIATLLFKIPIPYGLNLSKKFSFYKEHEEK